MSMDSEATWKDWRYGQARFPEIVSHLSEDDITDQLLPPPDCGVVLQLCVPHQNHIAVEDVSSFTELVSL